jgi:putative pyruvate formate lyase activating enzyme
MLEMQNRGVHNINFVTPTHYTLQIREAILKAKEKGFYLPVVWNTNAYENIETLQKMDGLIDIYLPDFRYFEAGASLAYSGAEDYPERAMEAILEMFRQVGHLQIDSNGLAKKGVLCRLLVLPGNLNQVDKILQWLSKHLGTSTCISLMAQYYPAYNASKYPLLSRPITSGEYEFALDRYEDLGFHNGFIQELAATPEWTPDFQSN